MKGFRLLFFKTPLKPSNRPTADLQLPSPARIMNYKLCYLHAPAARVWVKWSTLLNFYLWRLLFQWLNVLPYAAVQGKVRIAAEIQNKLMASPQRWTALRRWHAEFNLLLSTTHRNWGGLSVIWIREVSQCCCSSQTFNRCLEASDKHSKTRSGSDSVFHLN